MPSHVKHGRANLHPVKSTNIHSIGYDPDHQHLHVKFHSGSEGHYNNVDYNTFTAIMAAPSKGKALHALVKSKPKKHPWQPLDKPS